MYANSYDMFLTELSLQIANNLSCQRTIKTTLTRKILYKNILRYRPRLNVNEAVFLVYIVASREREGRYGKECHLIIYMCKLHTEN